MNRIRLGDLINLEFDIEEITDELEKKNAYERLKQLKIERKKQDLSLSISWELVRKRDSDLVMQAISATSIDEARYFVEQISDNVVRLEVCSAIEFIDDMIIDFDTAKRLKNYI